MHKTAYSQRVRDPSYLFSLVLDATCHNTVSFPRIDTINPTANEHKALQSMQQPENQKESETGFWLQLERSIKMCNKERLEVGRWAVLQLMGKKRDLNKRMQCFNYSSGHLIQMLNLTSETPRYACL